MGGGRGWGGYVNTQARKHTHINKHIFCLRNIEMKNKTKQSGVVTVLFGIDRH